MKHTDFRVKHGKLIMVLKESVWKSRNDCRFMWSFFSPENINEVILTVIGSFVYRPIVWALYVRNKLDIWDMWPNGCVDTKQIYVRHMTLQKYIYIYRYEWYLFCHLTNSMGISPANCQTNGRSFALTTNDVFDMYLMQPLNVMVDHHISEPPSFFLECQITSVPSKPHIGSARASVPILFRQFGSIHTNKTSRFRLVGQQQMVLAHVNWCP